MPNPLLAPELEPLEVEPGLLGRLGRVGLSGLAAAGNVLDTPGSMVRDTLALDNPLDNALPWNLASSEHRTSGRDLLRQYGLAGQEDTYANFWGGAAVEAVLDPFLWLGLGPLTQAGKVAQAAGKLGTVSRGAGLSKYTSTLRDLAKAGHARELAKAAKLQGVKLSAIADQPLQDLARVSIPGTNIGASLTAPGLNKLTGGVQPIIEGLGSLQDAARWSAPGRVVAGLFHTPAGGVFDELGQKVSGELYESGKVQGFNLRRRTAETAKEITEARQQFDAIYGQDIAQLTAAQHAGSTPKMARDATEHFFDRLLGMTADVGGDVDEAVRTIGLPLGKMPQPLQQKVVQLADTMQLAAKKSYDEYLDLGGMGGKLEELGADVSATAIEHFPRYGTGGEHFIDRLRRLFTRHGSSFSRADELRHLPKEVVNQLASDQAARGQNAATHIEQAYDKWLGRGTIPDPMNPGQKIPRWQSKAEHAAALAAWTEKRAQFPVFNNTTLDDWFKYESQVNTANLSLKTIHDLLAKSVSTNGRVTIRDVFRQAGNMDEDRASSYLSNILSKQTGQTILPPQVLDLKVPEEVARAIAGIKKVHDNPEWLQVIGGTVDELNRWFKSNVTIPFPAFHNRNLYGGQAINLITGHVNSLQDAKDYLTAGKDAWTMLRNLDADALSEFFVNGVVNPTTLAEGVELAGGRHWTFPEIRNPLDVRQTLGEVRADVAASPTTAQNPLLNRAGQAFDQARVGYGTAMRTGEKVAAAVEYMNRVPMYLYLRRKGWSAQAAAEEVTNLHIDYSKATPFERNVMKRLAPFYSWHRGISPVILGTLAKNPAGPMGQAVRASRLATSDDPQVPEWLGDTLAIDNPFGSREPGGRSYITGLGLPYESTLAYMGGGLRGFGRESLSQLNPLIKAPLEWSTNQSFFQTGPGGAGRPIDEMNPPIGQTLANVARFAGRDPSEPVPTPPLLEFAVSNSPLSRYVSTARQLTDPRKSLPSMAANLLTGVRVTDVSPGAQENILRQRANALIRDLGGREVRRAYFPDKEKLAAADQDLAASLEELLADLSNRSRQRRMAQ